LYCAQNPNADFNEALDITRPITDKEYLDTITLHCNTKENENSMNNKYMIKQIIYLDRNNTPDVWKDI
jgi:hypothetical protein